MTFAERLNHLLEASKEPFSGVILVTQGGKALASVTAGYAHRAWRIENRLETRFRTASVSKMFTAVSVLQLIDAGKLTLETRVAPFLNLENTAIPGEVTVYHLLTMTAGIADWFDESGDVEEWAALRRAHPLYLLRRNEDYLPLFVNAPPVAPVGAGHRYSNSSYILLGLMIERASGLSYFDYVRRNLFAQARMTRSDFVALDSVQGEVAEGYVPCHRRAGRAHGLAEEPLLGDAGSRRRWRRDLDG